jgi:hypothetical protein
MFNLQPPRHIPTLPMTSVAAMQQLSAIEGTANTPPFSWEPIFDRAVGAARRVGKCVPDRRGVRIPGQGGHRHAIPPVCGRGRALAGRPWRG